MLRARGSRVLAQGRRGFAQQSNASNEAAEGGVFAGSEKLVTFCSAMLGVCFAQQLLIPDDQSATGLAQYAHAAAEAERRGQTAVARDHIAKETKNAQLANGVILGPHDESAEPRYGGAFKQVAIPEPQVTEVRYGGAYQPEAEGEK